MRLIYPLLVLLLGDLPAMAQTTQACEPFEGQFQYCPLEREGRGGTLIVPFPSTIPQVALFAVDRGIGQVYRSRFPRDPAEVLQQTYITGVPVAENVQSIEIDGDHVITSFSYSGQNRGDIALSPRIVTLLDFEGGVIAVATNFPNPLAQDAGTMAREAQLRAHQDLVASIRPLGEN